MVTISRTDREDGAMQCTAAHPSAYGEHRGSSWDRDRSSLFAALQKHRRRAYKAEQSIHQASNAACAAGRNLHHLRTKKSSTTAWHTSSAWEKPWLSKTAGGTIRQFTVHLYRKLREKSNALDTYDRQFSTRNGRPRRICARCRVSWAQHAERKERNTCLDSSAPAKIERRAEGPDTLVQNQPECRKEECDVHLDRQRDAARRRAIRQARTRFCGKNEPQQRAPGEWSSLGDHPDPTVQEEHGKGVVEQTQSVDRVQPFRQRYQDDRVRRNLLPRMDYRAPKGRHRRLPCVSSCRS
jgi:hypothetical protein